MMVARTLFALVVLLVSVLGGLASLLRASESDPLPKWADTATRLLALASGNTFVIQAQGPPKG